MTIDRRTLIRRACMAASMATVPRWAAAGRWRKASGERAAAAAASDDTILVVVDLGGGNDGLNTIVPFGDSSYVAARPRVGLSGAQLLPITGEPGVGMHPSLSRLHGHLEAGRLALIQSVGYPGPDMSHFRSDDIWEKAGVNPQQESGGWIGRALDQMYRNDPDSIHGVAGSDVPAFHGSYVTSPTIDSTGGRGDPAQVQALKNMFAPTGSPNLDYVGHVHQVALADADIIEAALAAYTTDTPYPTPDEDNPQFGPIPFQQVAALIDADIGGRFFWVLQGGYDTHGSQLGDHEKLLDMLDRSLDAFYQDLVAHGHDQKVVIMTYSEFGRRVEDNDSGGTDHGSAAPMFVLGTKVKGGLYGEPPSLTDLDNDGNLKFAVDFRQVYATLLANWIGTDPKPVLGGVDYPKIPLL